MVIIVEVNCEFSECPAPELIKPCRCTEYNLFYCGNDPDLDLVNIFKTLEKNLTTSEKNFQFFTLHNRFITELEENTFKDITFDRIRIEYCDNLTKVHNNAFAGTDLVTRSVIFCENHAFSDISIFGVFSKFVNLEKLNLGHNNITEIPSNAFKGHEGQLKRLSLMGNSYEKIGSRPFYKLRSLWSLSISNTLIDYIPEYAFEFEEESNKGLALWFALNKLLNSSSFHQDSLIHFKRPTFIKTTYWGNHFEYLEESVFKKFLNTNPVNRIYLTSVNFDCNNCKNIWLTNQPNLMKRIVDLKCSNKKQINDPDNFKNCTL